VLILVVVALGAGAVAYAVHRLQGPSLLRASGIPSVVATRVADLMQLSPVPARPAPSFTLRDQRGRTFSLSSFRGRSVVLEFMDPHCTDICPLVSEEFVDAFKDLGPRATQTAFVAVNVNAFHASSADMATFSREHGLDTIPDWHFFTGRVEALRRVWSAYGIYVYAPNPNADIIHTSIVYFIDPQGRERFIAEPIADHRHDGTAYLPASQLSSWGQGIALVAGQLS